jgi:hypothetical protein
VIESCNPNPFEYDYERNDCYAALASLTHDEDKCELLEILEDCRSQYAFSKQKDPLALIRTIKIS